MFEFAVRPEEDGVLLDRVLLKRYPTFSRNELYKVLRKRDVRINGQRISQNQPLSVGMKVTVYANLPVIKQYSVVYENPWILLCEKQQGFLSEPDGTEEDSLLEAVNRDRLAEHPDAPPYALCHRLDRNTGGLIFLCKQPAFTEGISTALNERYYTKIYRALVWGDIRFRLAPTTNFTYFRAHHYKDFRQKCVFIYPQARSNTKPIETGVRFVAYDAEKNLSQVDIHLVTGRTHQIRAHLASLGHPIIGDGKYGNEKRNRLFGYRYQALWAYCYKPADDYAGAHRILSVPLEEILPPQTFERTPDFH